MSNLEGKKTLIRGLNDDHYKCAWSTQIFQILWCKNENVYATFSRLSNSELKTLWHKLLITSFAMGYLFNCIQ